MSKMSEKRAFETYPVVMRNDTVGMGMSVEMDANRYPRSKYLEGYEQAEKDLKLTWEEMKKIVLIADELTSGSFDDIKGRFPSEQSYYEEVTRLYYEQE